LPKPSHPPPWAPDEGEAAANFPIRSDVFLIAERDASSNGSNKISDFSLKETKKASLDRAVDRRIILTNEDERFIFKE